MNFMNQLANSILGPRNWWCVICQSLRTSHKPLQYVRIGSSCGISHSQSVRCYSQVKNYNKFILDPG